MTDESTAVPMVPDERWSTAGACNVTAPRAAAFLRDVLDVCRRHGYSIGHEDGHGAFLLEPYDVNTAEWLAAAHLSEDAPR